ncbi:queuosine precursor transporter [Escherichia coli]
MNVFSQTQRYKALFWLSLFHLLVITSSNYLVQLPVSILGFHTTWGAFSFPFIFLATDLTVRIFGAPLARRIIFAVMIPALLISYVISSLFYMGSWQGSAHSATSTCLSPYRHRQFHGLRAGANPRRARF